MVRDFPTLALSRSGGTGISQPSTKKGTPSHLNQNQKLAINVPLIPNQDHASGKPKTQPLPMNGKCSALRPKKWPNSERQTQKNA